MNPVCRHPIHGAYCTKTDDIFISPLVAHNTNRLDRQKDRSRLPYFVIPARLA